MKMYLVGAVCVALITAAVPHATPGAAFRAGIAWPIVVVCAAVDVGCVGFGQWIRDGR